MYTCLYYIYIYITDQGTDQFLLLGNSKAPPMAGSSPGVAATAATAAVSGCNVAGTHSDSLTTTAAVTRCGGVAISGMSAESSAANSSAPSAILYSEKRDFKMVREYMMGAVIGAGSQGKVREALHSQTLRR